MDKIKFRNNNILLLGDTHSLDRTLNMVTHNKNIDNFDIMFLGDGGEMASSQKYIEYRFDRINNICKKRNINLYSIRGNHTNPFYYKQNYQFSNFFLVPDYSSAEFPNGKAALLVGGGISVDRFYRKEGIDYWSDEITVYQKTKNHYDFLFAHDCPDYFNHSTDSLRASPYAPLLKDDKDLYTDALDQRYTIGKIVEDIEPSHCWSGHFHNSISEEYKGIKYRCLNIEELLELDANNP